MSFRGRQVAFAGQFAAITREEAAEMVAEAGGVPVAETSATTAFVIVGEDAWPVDPDGRLTANLRVARELIEAGHEIDILGEQEFLKRLGLPDVEPAAEQDRLYTTQQLGRILKLPVRRIRAWVRRGVLQPARTEHRLDYFDFRQATEVKRLAELSAQGVGVATIRRSLEQLEGWFPETESALHRLDALSGSQGLLVRLGPGQLAEPTGQLTLSFEDEEGDGPNAAPESTAPAATSVQTNDDDPERAAAGPPADAPIPNSGTENDTETENDTKSGGFRPPRLVVLDGGADPAAAGTSFRSPAIAGPAEPASPVGPPPVISQQPRTSDEWFELALELEDAEHLEEAARAYREALRSGGPSAEIAFNLGNVHYSLGRTEEALSRFEQAVEIDPEYAEAWNNLASVHAQFEEWDEAIAAGQRAVELSPEFLDAHYNLAEALHGAGRTPEARQHARRYLQADPRSPWANRLRRNLGLAS